MTNTDRLAQAIKILRGVQSALGALRPDDADEAEAWGDIDEICAALASLATAAVDGDAWNEAALFVNNCENAYDQSMQLWRRAFSTEGHDLVAFKTPVAHAMQQCLRNARGVVAALTAQCATAGNYVCDKDVCPTSVRFADGRIVRLVHDADHGYYLEIERAS